MKIKETRNYNLFEQHEVNRAVKKIGKLELSMKKNGWIDAYPMHVIENGGGKLKIKAGHHRFFVARKLGIPVKYVKCDDSSTIHELESATVHWSLGDFMDSYINAGKKDYEAVERYHDQTGIPLTAVIALLSGRSASSSSKAQMFKMGTYKLAKNQVHANRVKDIVMFMQDLKIKIASSAMFVSAISKILRVNQFSVSRFKRKLKSRKSMFEKQPSVVAYLMLIEKIYNFKSTNKLPLAFMAEEEAKRRAVA